jgi:hypothetical protein
VNPLPFVTLPLRLKLLGIFQIDLNPTKYLALKQHVALTEVPPILNRRFLLVSANKISLSTRLVSKSKVQHPSVSCGMAKTAQAILS